MRVPLSWLREYVDVELSPEELAERLTLLGMEVSAIERIGDDWQRVVVGELLEVAPHPNSNRLSLTRVRIGEGEPELSIVCGATNIAAGQRVPVALPGSVLPGDRRIEVTTIAGVRQPGHALQRRRAGPQQRRRRHPHPARRRDAGARHWPTSPATSCSTSTSSPTGATR